MTSTYWWEFFHLFHLSAKPIRPGKVPYSGLFDKQMMVVGILLADPA